MIQNGDTRSMAKTRRIKQSGMAALKNVINLGKHNLAMSGLRDATMPLRRRLYGNSKTRHWWRVACRACSQSILTGVLAFMLRRCGYGDRQNTSGHDSCYGNENKTQRQ